MYYKAEDLKQVSVGHQTELQKVAKGISKLQVEEC